MSLTADAKVGMSLEDIIKTRKKVEPKKAGAAKGKSKAPGAAAAGGAKGKKAAPTKKGAKANDSKASKAQNAASTKINKAAASASAKRAAKADQKRGLNQTGKATKAAVKMAVAKATQPKKKATPSAAAPAVTQQQLTSLKISFKPAELGKTTDKTVVAQINAVLARGKPPAANGHHSYNSGSNAFGRQVSANTHAARIAASKASLLAPSNGPQGRRIRKPSARR